MYSPEFLRLSNDWRYKSHNYEKSGTQACKCEKRKKSEVTISCNINVPYRIVGRIRKRFANLVTCVASHFPFFIRQGESILIINSTCWQFLYAFGVQNAITPGALTGTCTVPMTRFVSNINGRSCPVALKFRTLRLK